MKLKKIPRYFALSLLTIGASLILGFLSFGGMFALWPVLPLAFAAFGLSVAYEGEIYSQNIKGAWNKLLKQDYLKHQLAHDYLLDDSIDTISNEHTEFFKDYDKQLNLLHKFGHKRLTKESAAHKKQVEKTLSDMEKWFAIQLFSDKENKTSTPSIYEKKLRDWLALNQQDDYKTRLIKQHRTLRIVKAFCALSALFMGLGTTYLLVEAFSVIPLLTAFFATWPLLIVPMAAIAGAAYGLLTYNTVTDMIKSAPLRTWFTTLRKRFSEEGATKPNVFIATMAVLLIALAVALTICTAGTWWTVAKQARPLFAWMGKMPGFIMGVINPIITGSSAIVFNLQNTSESLKLIDDATRKEGSAVRRFFVSIKDGLHELPNHEHWLQIINPFRLLLKITIMPLRIMLFLGHLVSIAVNADRMPGVPQILSALFGFISEGFEDLHYFAGHDCTHKHEHGHGHEHALRKERLGQEHGHNHDLDLPTRLLNGIFYPVYFMAAGWDYLASKNNSGTRKSLSLDFSNAWDKQRGIQKEETVTLPGDAAKQPSADWQMEHVVYRIERYKVKHLQQVSIGRDMAQQKIDALTLLQQDLRSDKTAIKAKLAQAQENPIYNTHRFFNNGKTETTTFIENLPQRVNLQPES